MSSDDSLNYWCYELLLYWRLLPKCLYTTTFASLSCYKLERSVIINNMPVFTDNIPVSNKTAPLDSVIYSFYLNWSLWRGRLNLWSIVEKFYSLALSWVSLQSNILFKICICCGRGLCRADVMKAVAEASGGNIQDQHILGLTFSLQHLAWKVFLLPYSECFFLQPWCKLASER